jgi:acetamidase/formamidase
MKSAMLAVFLLALVAGYGMGLAAETHKLPATDQTTWVGYFDNSRPPVLKVKSGDIVELQTRTLYNDKLKPGTTMEQVIKWRGDNLAQGLSGHTLTGPIYIEGAEPGDVLQIDIIKLVPRPYAANYNMPSTVVKAGGLPEDFPEGQLKFIPLDLKKKTAKFSDNITVPMRPFMGIMALAPAKDGHVSTAPPSNFGGNIDCKELVAGTTLFLPVFKKGGLFATGDSHAGQGDGEVNLTAMETGMDQAVFRFTVRKDMKLNWPFAETPTHYITFAFNPDLNEAAKDSIREAIAFLNKTKGLTKLDAYSLISIGADLHVTQIVDGNKGVHVMIPKALFKK